MSISKNTVTTSPGPDPQTSLQKERAKAAFDPVKMHYFLEGSKERAEIIKTMTQQMERDPIMVADASYYDLTKAQQRELTAVRINRIARYLETESFDDFQRRLSLLGVFDPQTSTRIGVNLGLFISCIRGNGTPEQLTYWALNKETVYIKGIYGCFGMTEMAHGSNVAGLETTATFDEETDEFVINTPHIGATKWWIGGAAHSATHCTVYARLKVKGEDYGVKTFVVPLRDSNHDLNPGVTVGDIGAKMGRDGIDNGWIQFSNVRIPRFFMLQKWCKVSREGEVTLPPLEQLSYSALLGGRVTMCMDSFRMCARMSTIALRYAIGRRQFKPANADEDDPTVLETQLIDYPLHQKRLFPYLAASYVLSQGALKIERTIESTLSGLDDAVEQDDYNGIMKGIDEMKSLFIDSGSMKSTCTWLAAEAIDQCRQACGGHGYSSYSGFGKAYNDWVVQCTWEGDNNVLAVSIGKPLLKHVIAVIDNDKVVKGSSAFLSDTKQFVGEGKGDKPVLTTKDDILDLKKFIRGLEVCIIRITHQSALTVKAQKGNFDFVGGDLVIISKLKCYHYLLDEFVKQTEATEHKDLQPYLLDLARLFAASLVLDRFSGTFLTYNVISSSLVGKLSSEIIPDLNAAIRPHIATLTDSFQQSDMIVNSAIANYDGNIYENYFKTVKQQNPPSITKAPYSGALEAMLNRPSLEARDRFEKTGEAAFELSKE
ncbi:acyl-coenzyme A oxidase 4 [Suhomyces tanzawaensis NRRL Y-17324]|uniref:Acyl-coenzyme A oxidase n=1 Tax=Suhomyces tanzawaensis NRRL Y-17324 TaxID=984487 RepID=A0A1E4SG66_9ASCO|nr:acyl-coenzyme A oxidase 4 [Suhomyces tanzawaensis NRRL Y-17324]ODV78504.1 acyl-coenzyme A oxidase 4 [Suhomyces tanzawaensis NRRL Y-17324]